MANYLSRLVSRLSGETPAVRPRVRGRFEPAEKGSQLAAIPQLREVSEQSQSANQAAAQQPLRPVPSSFGEETPRATFAPRLVKESAIHSEIGTPAFAFSELRPQPYRKPERELRSEHLAPEQNSSLKEHRALPETRSRTHSASPQNAQTAATPLTGLKILTEAQPREIVRMEKANHGSGPNNAIRPADSSREESPSVRESPVDAALARPAFAQPVAVKTAEQRAATNELPRDIQIVIGKITVQATFPAQQAAPLPMTRPGPKLTLEQYLQQREGRR